MIRSLNFSLSNRCTATCVWCPDTRGTKHNMDMPFETAKKVIDEVATFEFLPKEIQLGENGEALLNKEFLKIARYIREKLPNVKVRMANNFALLNEEMARTILTENLLDAIDMNIDGHDAETYTAVKGLSYKIVMRNLKAFLKLRAEINPNFDFLISAMTLYEYSLGVATIMKPGTKPHNLKQNVPMSRFKDVVEFLATELYPYNHNIKMFHASPGMWAERKNIANVRDDYVARTQCCPIENRVIEEAFIAPNGDWYPCCLDDNNDQPLGNVLEMSITEIYYSEKRKQFIQHLIAKEFDKIGYPCNTVSCCHTVSVTDEMIDKYYVPKGKIVWMKKEEEVIKVPREE